MKTSDFKKISQNTLIYGLGGVFGRLFTLISAPILTRIFSPSDYGIISLVQISLGLAVIFAGLNINSGVTFYYFKYEKSTMKKNLLSSGILIISSFGILITILLYNYSNSINILLNLGNQTSSQIDISDYIKIGSFGVFSGILKTSLQTILRIKDEPKKYIAVEILTLISTFFITIFLVIKLNLGIEGIFWGSTFGSFFGMILSFYFCKHYLGSNFSISFLGPILLYALPQFPGCIVNWIQSQTGRLFINYYSNLNEQGLYSIAFTISAIILLVTNSFRLAFDPYALSIMKKEDAKSSYSKIFSIYILIFGSFVALISSFAKPIILIITPSDYYSSYSLIFWLVAGGFLYGISNIISIGICITTKTKFLSYAQIITFISIIILSFLLVPKYGALGASIAYFIAAFVESYSKYIFAQKLYPIEYPFLKFVITIFSLITIESLNIFLVRDMSFINSSLIGIFSFSIILTILYFLFIQNSGGPRRFLKELNY